MPRNSKRSKPYTSLRKQNRHYRQKRAQFVKGLCASAHMNGSEFLILLASPKGQVETFASEAFRPNVSRWLPANLLREAKETASAAQEKRLHEREDIDQSDRSDDDDNEEESDEEFASRQREPQGAPPGIGQSRSVSLSSSSSSACLPDISPPFNPDISGGECGLSQPASDFALTPSSATSTLFSPDVASFPTFTGPSNIFGNGTILPHYPSLQGVPPPSISSHNHPRPDCIPYIPVPDKFYDAKFAALQQKATKRIAKAWIKVIEPKKQTRFPYNKGEASKPSWWPRGLRHKEPDHLKSQERTELLISILRSPLIRVEKLELKTAEEASFLQQDKIPLLREIYRVAREEERARDMGFIVHHGGSAALTSSTASLKRPCPEDSDTEDAPFRPLPDGWNLTTAAGPTNVYHDTDNSHASGVSSVGSGSSGSLSLDPKVDHLQVANSPLQRSTRFGSGHPIQGGPFTFQPLHNYNTIHDPERDGAADPLHVLPASPFTVSSSASYIIAQHAYADRLDGDSSKGDVPMHSTRHSSLSLAHPRPQKHPRIDTMDLYSRRASVSESVSGSNLAESSLEEALRSTFFPAISLENETPSQLEIHSVATSIDTAPPDMRSAGIHLQPSFDVEAWQDHHKEDDTPSRDEAPTVHAYPSGAGCSTSAHMCDAPYIRDGTHATIIASSSHQIDDPHFSPHQLQWMQGWETGHEAAIREST